MKRSQIIHPTQKDKTSSCTGAPGSKREATSTTSHQCTFESNVPAADNSNHQCRDNTQNHSDNAIRPLKRARRSSCSPGLQPDNTAVTGTDTNIAPAPTHTNDAVQQLKEKARLLSEQQNYSEACKVLEQVLPLQDGHALMQSQTELGNLCRDLGDFDASFNYHNLALNMYLTRSSNSTENRAADACMTTLAIVNLRHIAAIYLQFRHCQEALLCYNFIYRIQHETEGTTPVREVASTISCIALMHYLMEHYPEALRFYQEELRLRIQLHNGNMEHEDVAIALNSIGIVYFQLENFDHARQSFQSCLQIRQCLLGDGCTAEHECPTNNNGPHCCCYDLAMVYFNLAAIAMKQGDDSQASRLYRRSMELKKVVFGLCHPEIAVDYQYLGHLFLDSGDSKTAIEYYTEAYKVVEKLGNNNNEITPPVDSNDSDDGGNNPQRAQSAAQQLLVIIGNIHLLNGNVERMMISFKQAARLETGTNIMDHVGVFGDHLYSISRMHPPCAPEA